MNTANCIVRQLNMFGQSIEKVGGSDLILTPLARPPTDEGIAVGIAWTVQAAVMSSRDGAEYFIVIWMG